MQEFLLILRGDGMNHLSPDELQNIMSEYKNWVEELGENYLGGQRLEDNGALLTSKTASIVTDGPFLESKEIIAGFFVIQAKDQDEANQIVQSSPHLGLYAIEVRPIAFPKMK
ncbi:MAG: YciI family protein [Reichenbachiella sp.]|uniref:YciI family protein n=1 Tax=Reichenbachiella sp. TaxID=2184521 RepID=UPI003263DF48